MPAHCVVPVRRRAAPARRGVLTLLVAALCGVTTSAHAQRLLVPMDEAQTDHLKAYGLTYNAMKSGVAAEWLLNYRGGSFLLPDAPELRRQAALAGISLEPVSDAALQAIRREMSAGNMEGVPLEKAPRIAVYSPPGAQPWDDAVTLALRYAGIDFTPVYDEQVELTSDTLCTHFMFTVPSDAPAVFATPLVALRWVVRFQFTATLRGGTSVNGKIDQLTWPMPLLVVAPDVR